MSYNHQQIAEAVHTRLRDDPRTSLGLLADRLGMERHTIRRALLSQLGMTYRDLQRKCLMERGSALRDEHPQRSAKEMSFAVGYRSAASLSRFNKRERGRNLR